MGTAPAQANARVSNGVTLHLVDGHFGRVSLNELDEAATLSRRNLDIGDLAEALEEGSELVLGNVARETTDKHSSVVGIGELVHRLGGTIVAHGRSAHAIHARTHTAGQSARHTTHRTGRTTTRFVLGSSGRDAHRPVAAVNALHLGKSSLLVALIGETHKPVATGHARDGIGHNLGRLARREARLEERNEDILVDLRAKVANKDRVFGTAVIASVSQSTTRCPVELEWASSVGNDGAIEGKGLGSSLRRSEINEAVTGISGGS